jgi:uncharacterized protein YjiS (DUF1127 family)
MTRQPHAALAHAPLAHAALAIDPATVPGDGIGHLSRTIAAAGRLLRAWRHHQTARRDLRYCAYLDPRFARDIGLTDGDIAKAARMPSWDYTASQNWF